MGGAVTPVIFVHIDTGIRKLCLTEKARARFHDNRKPEDWFKVPASDSDLRSM